MRSKLVDNGDGSYTASYTPEISGEYKIDVSLFKEPIAGSPFTLVTSTRTPHPPHCSIAGDALYKAVSREQQHVEVRFCDALGNVAHAEDLDCYAEPIDDAFLSVAAEEELGLPDWLKAGQPASPRMTSPRPSQDVTNAAKANKPLVVRANASVDSPLVCKLSKGKRTPCSGCPPLTSPHLGLRCSWRPMWPLLAAQHSLQRANNPQPAASPPAASPSCRRHPFPPPSLASTPSPRVPCRLLASSVTPSSPLASLR